MIITNRKLAIILAAVLSVSLLLAGCRTSGENPDGSTTAVSPTAADTDAVSDSTGQEQTPASAAASGTSEGTAESTAVSGTSASSGRTSISPEMENLQKTLAQMTDDDNTWAVYVKNLTNGESIGINSQKQVLSASIIKIFIAGAYYQALDEGQFADDYQQQLSDMIIYSDNTATNTLIDLIGMDYINQFIQDQGFSEKTQLNRKMLEDGTENYVTAKDCGDVLERIYNRTYVSAEASEQIWNYLEQQNSRNKIPAGITDEAAVIGNKTGEIGGNAQGSFVIGDVALIYGSHADMIICLIENGSYSEDIKSLISQMAGTIYETCNGEDAAGTVEGNIDSTQQPSADA